MRGLLALGMLLVVGCSDSTEPLPVSDSSVPSCTITATITADTGQRTITGVGNAACDHPATISIEVCTQYAPAGAPTFTDIMCTSSSLSSTMSHAVSNLSACLIGTDKSYRAQVNVKIDGVEQPQKLSATVACD
ncbi:MAG TPA: hypothetical protein VGM90_02930 [Kofleriaceae bacterium]